MAVARNSAQSCACILAVEQRSLKEITIFTHAECLEREPLVIPKLLLDLIAFEYKEGVLAPIIELDL